jgi:hypothetical protein
VKEMRSFPGLFAILLICAAVMLLTSARQEKKAGTGIFDKAVAAATK